MKQYLRNLQIVVQILCGLLPIPVTVFACFAPERIWQSLIFSGLCLLLCCAGNLLPVRYRRAAGVVGLLIFAGLTVLLNRYFPGALPVYGFAALLGGVVFLAGLRIAGWNSAHHLHPGFYGVFLLAYLLAAKLLRTEAAGDVPEGMFTVLYLTFACCLLLSLLEWNRICLSHAVFGNRKLSAALRRTNSILVGLLFGSTVLITLVPGVVRGIQSLWNRLAEFLRRLPELLLGQSQTQQIPETTGTLESLPAMPEEEVLAREDMLLTVFKIIACIGAVAVVTALLVFLIRKLIKLCKKLLVVLSEAPGEEYEEEITSTRSPDFRSRHPVRRRRKAGTSPAERIRWRYGVLTDRHPEWAPGKTARENLPEQTAEIYERARYSTHESGRDEAEEFMKKTSRI